MNIQHKRAASVVVLTLVLDSIFGVLYGLAEHIPTLHGMYCALGTATTVGCDIPPDNAYGYVLAVVMMVTVVPLFAATFSLFTSGLTAAHVDAVTEVQTKAITGLTHSQTREIKDHISG